MRALGIMLGRAPADTLPTASPRVSAHKARRDAGAGERRRLPFALSFAMLLAGAAGLSCEPPTGIVSPEVFTTRDLKLMNRSRGYVAFRITPSGTDAFVTPALPPGGAFKIELGAWLDTLCPDGLTVDVFAYARARPDLSVFQDETLLPAPYASARLELLPTRDYGCRADVSYTTLDDAINLTVWEVDPAAQAIGVDAAWMPLQRVIGLTVDDPPAPATPKTFPLAGRVVNLDNRPIANAEVRLADIGESVFTDAAGRFVIQRPRGEYWIEVVIPGIDVAPPRQRFPHEEGPQALIEFIALTNEVPNLTLSGESADGR